MKTILILSFGMLLSFSCFASGMCDAPWYGTFYNTQANCEAANHTWYSSGTQEYEVLMARTIVNSHSSGAVDLINKVFTALKITNCSELIYTPQDLHLYFNSAYHDYTIQFSSLTNSTLNLDKKVTISGKNTFYNDFLLDQNKVLAEIEFSCDMKAGHMITYGGIANSPFIGKQLYLTQELSDTYTDSGHSISSGTVGTFVKNLGNAGMFDIQWNDAWNSNTIDFVNYGLVVWNKITQIEDTTSTNFKRSEIIEISWDNRTNVIDMTISGFDGIYSLGYTDQTTPIIKNSSLIVIPNASSAFGSAAHINTIRNRFGLFQNDSDYLGTCSNVTYITRSTCEGNGETWSY